RFVLRDASVNPLSNLPPVADAGVSFSRTVNGGEVIQLDGSASADPEGSPLTYVWRQLGGPDLTFTNGATATPSFNAPILGAPVTLTFELVVNDGESDSAPAITQITLNPPGVEELIFNGSFENLTNSFVGGNSGVMSLPAGSEVIPGWTTVQAEL